VYPENKSYDKIVKIVYDEISKKLWFLRYTSQTVILQPVRNICPFTSHLLVVLSPTL
jgi:hypothetical protein